MGGNPRLLAELEECFGEGEREQGATIRSFRIVQREGNREVARAIDHRDAVLQSSERNILTRARTEVSR